MGRLVVVRHAQATYFKVNYDQLSELGERQAQALADYWLKMGKHFDRAYLGSLQRHQQTMTILQQAYEKAGRRFPEAEVLPGLNESSAWNIVQHFLPQVEPEAAERRIDMQGKNDISNEQMQTFARAYKRISYLWMRGELNVAEAGFETWKQFRQRVSEAVSTIAKATREGETALVITSGGPIGLTMGLALDLSDEKALELSWIVQNTSLTVFRTRSQQLSLRSFNAVPHLSDQKLITYV